MAWMAFTVSRKGAKGCSRCSHWLATDGHRYTQMISHEFYEYTRRPFDDAQD
jgi:hypothetical protein